LTSACNCRTGSLVKYVLTNVERCPRLWNRFLSVGRFRPSYMWCASRTSINSSVPVWAVRNRCRPMRTRRAATGPSASSPRARCSLSPTPFFLTNFVFRGYRTLI
jgi:hypothetical protein